MATDRTFTVAGVSVKDGTLTFRFTNGTVKARTSILLANEHSQIDLRELPKEMDQAHAIAWLYENMPKSRKAVISTRAADLNEKSEVIIEAEALWERSKMRGTRGPAAKKAAPKKAGRKAAVAKAKRGVGRPRADAEAEAA